MTRTLFFLTSLAAMVTTLAAVLIRLELAQADVSFLFLTQDGVPDGEKFNGVSMMHAMTAYLAVTLLGCTMASAACDRDGPLAAPILWLGLIYAGLTAVALVLWIIVRADADVGQGWVLYPPLPDTAPETEPTLPRLQDLMLQAQATLSQPNRVSNLFVTPSAGMILLGLYALLGTRPGLRWITPLGAVLVLVVCATGAWVFPTSVAPSTLTPFALAVIPFAIAACVSLTDDAPAWIVLLCLGLIFSVAGHLFIVALDPVLGADTLSSIAGLYVFPLGLAWYALPALMVFRFGTRLPDWVVWSLPAVITIGVALWIAPMVTSGQNGQPAFYMDYPQALAPFNLAASVGVGLFGFLYLAIVTYVHRTRATDGP